MASVELTSRQIHFIRGLLLGDQTQIVGLEAKCPIALDQRRVEYRRAATVCDDLLRIFSRAQDEETRAVDGLEARIAEARALIEAEMAFQEDLEVRVEEMAVAIK